MAGSTRRERQLARERHERQQARRAAAQAAARRRRQVLAAALAVLAVIGGVFALTQLLGGGGPSVSAEPAKTPTPAASSGAPSASASAAAKPGTCSYPKSPEGAKGKTVTAPPAKPAIRAATTTRLDTSVGTLDVSLDAVKAPCTVGSFVSLARQHYFDKTSCHRLTTKTDGIFVLQCGDPSGTGTGGPGYQFGVENAPADGRYPAGTIAMARSQDPGSNGSQFFIVYADTSLPTEGGGYSVFGRVTGGLDAVNRVAAAGVDPKKPPAPRTPVRILSVAVPGAAS